MKNQIVLAISAIVLSKAGFSQTPKDSSASRPAQADAVILLAEPVKKNELSVDLVPLIIFAAGAEGPFDRKGTIQYKRQVKSNLYLRVGVTVMKQIPERRFDNISVLPADARYDIVTYRGYETRPRFNLNAGLEYRWGKHRIKQFTGMDIGYLHGKETFTSYFAYVPKYSNYDPNNYYDSGHYQHNGPDSTDLYANSLTSSITENTFNGVVLTPFYGIQYHFSKRFFFSMQLGLQMEFAIEDSKTENFIRSYGPPSSQTRLFNFELREGILNNFSIAYRF